MTKDRPFTTYRHSESAVPKVLTPELQQKFAVLANQMGEFAGRLTHLCESLEAINDAVFDAQEIAECLVDGDLVRACEAMQRRQLPESAGDIDGDWISDTN